MVPKNGASHVLMRGNTMGRLVVTTATKDSRVPQAPASCAPLTGSCRRKIRNKGQVPFSANELTTNTKTLFRMAQISTNTPAPRIIVDAIFFSSRKLDDHSIGRGIEMRYMSVATFDANETQMMGLEMAAWHRSKVGVECQQVPNVHNEEGNALPGLGEICQ